jgi:hypothetical protein
VTTSELPDIQFARLVNQTFTAMHVGNAYPKRDTHALPLSIYSDSIKRMVVNPVQVALRHLLTSLPESVLCAYKSVFSSVHYIKLLMAHHEEKVIQQYLTANSCSDIPADWKTGACERITNVSWSIMESLQQTGPHTNDKPTSAVFNKAEAEVWRALNNEKMKPRGTSDDYQPPVKHCFEKLLTAGKISKTKIFVGCSEVVRHMVVCNDGPNQTMTSALCELASDNALKVFICSRSGQALSSVTCFPAICHQIMTKFPHSKLKTIDVQVFETPETSNLNELHDFWVVAFVFCMLVMQDTFLTHSQLTKCTGV